MRRFRWRAQPLLAAASAATARARSAAAPGPMRLPDAAIPPRCPCRAMRQTATSTKGRRRAQGPHAGAWSHCCAGAGGAAAAARTRRRRPPPSVPRRRTQRAHPAAARCTRPAAQRWGDLCCADACRFRSQATACGLPAEPAGQRPASRGGPRCGGRRFRRLRRARDWCTRRQEPSLRARSASCPLVHAQPEAPLAGPPSPTRTCRRLSLWDGSASSCLPMALGGSACSCTLSTELPQLCCARQSS
mmetsp:Transcript_9886/g.29888  ORF Transcript_9886/g.29888 Transcript_9886/m.29888 type:complete len:246 (+) Transcript_9886:770-1507(+)